MAKEEKENRRLVFSSSIKGEIWKVHVFVVQWRMYYTKKRDAREKLLFSLI